MKEKTEWIPKAQGLLEVAGKVSKLRLDTSGHERPATETRSSSGWRIDNLERAVLGNEPRNCLTLLFDARPARC